MDIKIKDFEGPWTSYLVSKYQMDIYGSWLRWSNSIQYLATLQAMKTRGRGIHADG